MRNFLTVVLSALLAACSQSENPVSADAQRAGLKNLAEKHLTIYKTPTCGCCSAWVDHVQQAGLRTDVVDQESVAHIKDRFGLPANARSCHTAISKQGWVFEGHVPAKYINAFIEDPPEGAIGLIVPAMPIGSPGMEVDEQFSPYTIFAFKQDGSLSPYAQIQSYQQQF